MKMKDKSKHSSVVDMAQARREHDQMEWRKGYKLPDGTRLKPYTLYTPPPPYGAKPCRVISLKDKALMEAFHAKES